MNDPPRNLAQLQEWMQTVITHPAGLDAGLASAAARQTLPNADSLESVILPSQNLTSRERLAVYGHAYFARLVECLRDQFPALHSFVGTDVFDGFAFAYLREFPSQSYTLGRLADRFVEFLDQTRRQRFDTGSTPDGAAPTWSRFLVDLARLEHAIDQVFDGQGIEHNPPDLRPALAALAPTDWPHVRFTPAVCLRLLEFEFPVNDVYTEFRNTQTCTLPSAHPTYLALTRNNYVVHRYPLTQPQFLVLCRLVAGDTVTNALAHLACHAPQVEPSEQQLFDWFSAWTRAAFFVQLTADSSPTNVPDP